MKDKRNEGEYFPVRRSSSQRNGFGEAPIFRDSYPDPAFSSIRELAQAQADKAGDFLRSELMMTAQNVPTEPNHASFSERRVEIPLLNRQRLGA